MRSGLRPHTLQKYQRIQEAYDAGHTTGAEITEYLSIPRSTVYRALLYLGLSGEQPRENRRLYRDCPSSALPEILRADSLWIAEFRGFFYGEGYVGLGNETQSYNPRLTINLRLDDEAILQEIASVLGGRVCYPKKCYSDQFRNSCPQARWNATGWPLCRAILEETGLAYGLLPAKKRGDIVLFYEAILARYQLPFWLYQDERDVLHQYYLDLIEIKRFRL